MTAGACEYPNSTPPEGSSARVSASGVTDGARDTPGAPGPAGGRTGLRERLDAAIRPVMLLGLQDAELDGSGGTQRINDWADWIVDRVLEVLDQPEAADTVPRPKRFRITDEHLQGVAGAYRDALAAGSGPTRAVSERFRVPHSTAAKWVGHARRRGFLPPV